MNSRSFLVPGGVVLVCLWSSCRGSGPAEALADESFSYDAPTMKAVPEGMRVRPDVLLLPFTFRMEAEELRSAVPTLKTAVAYYTKEVAESAKAEVVVRMTDLEMASGKLRTRNEVLAQGTLEVALPESLDFWGRTALVANLRWVGEQQLERAVKMNSGVRFFFGAARAQVRDPEAHRAELVKRWVERARDFTSQAQSAQAPLQIIGCAPPAEVTQQPVSVDEVVLTLAVSCRLDVVAK